MSNNQKAIMDDERNLHIFLNSIKTITNELDTDDYRVLCSSKSADKIQNYALPTSPVIHLLPLKVLTPDGVIIPIYAQRLWIYQLKLDKSAVG